MSILVCCLVGIASGVVATFASRENNFGLITDLIAGIAGACATSLLIGAIGWRVPFGVAGVAGIATLGAAMVLIALRAVHRFLAPPEVAVARKRRR